LNTDEILNYCLLKDGSYLDFPFGDIPICVKVANRLFAQVYPKPEDYKITLNCARIAGEIFRDLYPNTVVRGYHCPPVQQPYFNTVLLDNEVTDDELKVMIDHSYSVVLSKLPKRVRDNLGVDDKNENKGFGR
jgi:predicted DNA-binding protein (MmcQ/YjbR family)